MITFFFQVNDILGRLGLQMEVAQSMDWGSIGVIVSDNIGKIKYFNNSHLF